MVVAVKDYLGVSTSVARLLRRRFPEGDDEYLPKTLGDLIVASLAICLCHDPSTTGLAAAHKEAQRKELL